MASHSTPRSLRIGAAVAFTTGALAMVLQDILDLRNPWVIWQGWTLAHSLAVLAVAGVTLTAELAWDARKSRRYVVAFGFLLVTIVGLGLIVYNSVGRQADAATSKTDIAQKHNALVAAAERRLGKAETAKADAVRASIEKSTEKNCATRCAELLKKAQDDAEAEVKTARDELRKAGQPIAVATVSPKAKQWGETLSLIGIPPALTEQLASRLEYVFWTLLFEIGAMVSWCFVRERPLPETVATPATDTVSHHVRVALWALFLKTVALCVGTEAPAKATEATQATVDPELATLRDRFFKPDNDPDPQPTPPGNRRRRKLRNSTKATVPARPSATVHQFPAGNRAQKVSEGEALAWLRGYAMRHGCLGEQDVMADQLAVNKGSVSKWLDKWEDERIIERQQVGRRKIVRMLPVSASG